MGGSVGAQPPRRTVNRFTVLKVKKFNSRGYHCDAGGLYLRVRNAAQRAGYFTLPSRNGRAKWGWETFPDISLAAGAGAPAP
jgi:hypothetical protein